MNTNQNAEAVTPVTDFLSAEALPIHERFIAWTTNQPDEACRRWSYEIEAVGLGEVSVTLQNLGFDTHNDPSVNGADDCYCSCDSCAHSCNCDRCDIYNGYESNDHCGECSDTEAAPSDYKPVITTHDTDRLAPAMKALRRAGASADESCGGHIHVNAVDLSAQQVASVMKMWRKVNELLPDLIGREPNHYAELNEAYDWESVTNSEYPSLDRYKSVNALNWVNGKASDRKATLEFRQFAGSLDEQVIVARGYLCRALVEHAKASKPIYWLMRATTAEALLTELGLGFIR